MASLTKGRTCSEGLKTSTMSIDSTTSGTLEYHFLFKISLDVGLTGRMLKPCSDRYLGTKWAAFSGCLDIPTTATFVREKICFISSSE